MHFCFKNTILFLICFSFLDANAQNWSTFGGQSLRSGLSKITGPQSASIFWGVTSSNNSSIGMAVYTFGDRFVNARTNFSPYNSKIECRDLQNGSLLWTSPFISNTSILYAIGFTEDAVYAHDYNTDSLYALEPATGAIKWRSQFTSHTFGAYPGAVFSCEGDPIVNGPSGISSTMRINRLNGDTLWTNNELIAIGPPVGLAATSNRIYRLTGAISQPIVLSALDMETGITLYESFPLPGDPDQENPIALGPENRIYFWRDGGNFYAYEDVGNAVVPVWSYVPQTTTGSSLTGNISVGPDSTVYIFDDDRIKRLSHATGQVINTSLALFNQGFISIGSDGTVYANTQLGTYYAFTPDLQTVKWQYGFGANTYNNMSLSKDGIMVLTAAGNQITALQTPNLMKPVADFFVSNRMVSVGQQIDFFDQSSFAPTSWTWSFPGANFTSSGATNPSGISYSSAGIYPVQLMVANAFGSDSLVKSCYIEVLGTASMTETADDFWSIWPNPSGGVFQLQINHDVQRGRVVVMDMTGREVRSVEHDAATMTLDFSDLKNGLYILRFGQNLEYASVLVKH